ncbi:bifunctional DNA-formamidopyrimidine glycosylase/DNA-(apurinic or apyrimidinic site) lyase [Chthonobacter rhizosphaerae]|uniref:bifunctional DNA-formamidopyrimidine glycosylase/DNA-(apurinic or apyrimidinic site) lyase n=1 Tax=Chthonobacter rhizosphaerae TaxID=2735553 RepID=UPI0015EF7DDE|nr:bifunctional DNA-formamidopyrimidine glycosylase/DNA-(apurinic or apyrimidinic site) lyase [Chthonobacter rhizosphaerae]
MPELPEVETVRRGLAPVLEGARFCAVTVRRPDLRFPFPELFAERLAGRTVTGLSRRAKYLVGDLDDGSVLLMHLGMSGSFRITRPGDELTPGGFHHERSKDAAHDHVVFRTDGGADVTYNDPRRFGFITLTTRAEAADHPLLRHLGREPTGNDLDATYLAAAFAGRRTSLKAALLDQTVIAGLGNIYVCEALWRARLSPVRAAGSIVPASGAPGVRLERLVTAIREVIAEAIAAGGSSLRDYVHADGSLGYFQHRFAVYDREGEPCPRPDCRGVVGRIVQSNRSTFFCPVCQR